MLSEGLGHINRNGDLLWMDIHWLGAKRLWDEMKQKGLVEKNAWSGKWTLTPAGRKALEEADAKR